MPTQSHFDFSYSSVVSAMHQRPIFFLFAHIKKKFIVEQEVDGKTGTLSLRGKRKSMKYSKKIFITPRIVLSPPLAIKISTFSTHTAGLNKILGEKPFIPVQWKEPWTQSGGKGSHPSPAIGWVTLRKWSSNSGLLTLKIRELVKNRLFYLLTLLTSGANSSLLLRSVLCIGWLETSLASAL